jgi:hypothetical protein
LILRVLSGRIPSGRLQSVTAALERHYVPRVESPDGPERYLVAFRAVDGTDDEHEIAYLTLWTDFEAASRAFDGQLSALRLLDDVDHGEILEHVEYYEVEIGETRVAPGRPRFLRLTAGTVGRGLDADIQRDLRNRLGELGPEVVDAYIGRRVKGSLVEIGFISTWTDAVPAAQLEQPIWPDISEQYDTFSLRVFRVLLEGSKTP